MKRACCDRSHSREIEVSRIGTFIFLNYFKGRGRVASNVFVYTKTILHCKMLVGTSPKP